MVRRLWPILLSILALHCGRSQSEGGSGASPHSGGSQSGGGDAAGGSSNTGGWSNVDITSETDASGANGGGSGASGVEFVCDSALWMPDCLKCFGDADLNCEPCRVKGQKLECEGVYLGEVGLLSEQVWFWAIKERGYPELTEAEIWELDESGGLSHLRHFSNRNQLLILREGRPTVVASTDELVTLEGVFETSISGMRAMLSALWFKDALHLVVSTYEGPEYWEISSAGVPIERTSQLEGALPSHLVIDPADAESLLVMTSSPATGTETTVFRVRDAQTIEALASLPAHPRFEQFTGNEFIESRMPTVRAANLDGEIGDLVAYPLLESCPGDIVWSPQQLGEVPSECQTAIASATGAHTFAVATATREGEAWVSHIEAQTVRSCTPSPLFCFEQSYCRCSFPAAYEIAETFLEVEELLGDGPIYQIHLPTPVEPLLLLDLQVTDTSIGVVYGERNSTDDEFAIRMIMLDR